MLDMTVEPASRMVSRVARAWRRIVIGSGPWASSSTGSAGERRNQSSIAAVPPSLGPFDDVMLDRPGVGFADHPSGHAGSGGDHRLSLRAELALSLGAGAGYAGYFVLLGHTSSDSGQWPVGASFVTGAYYPVDGGYLAR